MDSIFGEGDDNAVNESPEEKKARGAKDPFGFPVFPDFKTGPVQHPHSSINDLFQNVAKPGPHPKFAEKEENSGVQELKETNKKVELTEADKASGIVSDISSHNMPVHHTAPAPPPPAPPVAAFVPPELAGPVQIKLVNPMKKTLESSLKREVKEKAKKKDLAPRKIK